MAPWLELADATDLKSVVRKRACGFDSHRGHGCRCGWNWKTRHIQNVVLEREYRFESCQRHYGAIKSSFIEYLKNS